LAETADTVVSVPEIFAYWLQAGRIDVGFLGAAQIDRYANINTTVIGGYRKPRVRLPGAGGAPEVAAAAGHVLVMLQHRQEAFVERLDFVTSVGFLDGGDARARAGFSGRGPSKVFTDLGVLEPDPVTRELVLSAVHPGVTAAQVIQSTSWPLRVHEHLGETRAVDAGELAALRTLRERSERAHAALDGA